MDDRYLFKAKRIDNGEWIIGFLTFHKTGKAFIKPIFGDARSSEEIDKTTICQRIGLNDKNGNLIWENDVIKKESYIDYDAFSNSEEYIGIVKFTDCAWVVETIIGKCTRPIFEAVSYSEDVKHLEVIGNVFDNKELLERE